MRLLFLLFFHLFCLTVSYTKQMQDNNIELRYKITHKMMRIRLREMIKEKQKQQRLASKLSTFLAISWFINANFPFLFIHLNWMWFENWKIYDNNFYFESNYCSVKPLSIRMSKPFKMICFWQFILFQFIVYFLCELLHLVFAFKIQMQLICKTENL